MARAKRASTAEEEKVELQIRDLAQQMAIARRKLRELRNNETSVGKLLEKLDRQLATAKWTARAIKELQEDWDEVAFYKTVEPRKPTLRGRAARAARLAQEAAES
jgi:hypothetical protein